MVLVDTSVWIRFLRNRGAYATELDRLLALDEVAGHELVYGELLIGDVRGRGKLLADYESMHEVAMVPQCEVVAFARDRGLHGRGVDWIDIHILASAMVGRTPLWTSDARLAAVAREQGVGYDALV